MAVIFVRVAVGVGRMVGSGRSRVVVSWVEAMIGAFVKQVGVIILRREGQSGGERITNAWFAREGEGEEREENSYHVYRHAEVPITAAGDGLRSLLSVRRSWGGECSW